MQLVRAVLPLWLFLLSLSLPLFAQSVQRSVTVPRVVNISGVFRPADGRPAAAVETVTFAIYAEAEGGAPLWQETQTVALGTGGGYAILLGSTLPDGIPPDVFASGEGRWLATRFERPGEVEGPRRRITSVPYALRASDADTLGGLPASAYLRTVQGADAGRVHRSGVTSQSSADLVTPGTPNRLAKYINNDDVGDSAVFELGGRVGIGTTTPADLLHVSFANPDGSLTGLAVQNTSGTASAYSGMLFYDQNGALGQFQGFNNSTHEYRINNVARAGSSFNGSINFMIGSTPRFFVSSNPGVGIGTTAPAANLEVSNATTGTLISNIAATTFNSPITPLFGSVFVGRRAHGSAAAPAAVVNGDTLAFFGGVGYAGSGFGGASAGMTIRSAETWTDLSQASTLILTTTPPGSATARQRMVINPFGAVGFGTPAPAGAMEVFRNLGEGNAQIFTTTFDAGESAFVARAARGSAVAAAPLQSGDQLGIFALSGFATTGFGQGLAGMAGFAAENWSDTAQGSALVFATTPISTTQAEIAMSILPSGNVGIGTPIDPGNQPTALDKLQVFGDIRVGISGTNGCVKDFAGTGIAGTCSSDRRLKRNITPFAPVLSQLTALQPVHYFWRAVEFPERHFGDSQAYGLIAQEVETVLPELVVTGKDGFKAVDYSKLPLLTIQAVKELKAENDALKQRVADLERLITEALAASGRR